MIDMLIICQIHSTYFPHSKFNHRLSIRDFILSERLVTVTVRNRKPFSNRLRTSLVVPRSYLGFTVDLES